MKLSEQLAEMSARAVQVEERVESLRTETLEKRDAQVAALETRVETARSNFESSVKTKGDEIATAWSDLNSSVKARAETVKSAVMSKKEAIEAGHARLRADMLEENAAATITFAVLAIEESEFAVVEAIDARIIADSFD
jgi:hypothetical protein